MFPTARHFLFLWLFASFLLWSGVTAVAKGEKPDSIPKAIYRRYNMSNPESRELSDSQRLLRDLFRDYRPELRPIINDSEAVNVTMHLWFKQVLKVDEIDQILTIYIWVEQYWNDAFLQWDPSDYGQISVLHVPADKVWRPDILVYNNADMNIQENELTTNAVLNYTGDVICFRSIITKITCNLEMTYFPFDQQKCHMMFASWSYDGSKVFIAPTEARGNLQYYIENTEWKLIDFFFVRNIKYYDCCPEPYPDITYYFILERNPSYYILNLILPSVFITVVTMVGFFTPYSSTGENTEKVSLGVTALLSLAIILLMVADKMPATSKVIPLIGKYYIGLIWLIFAATIITTITLRLQSKGNNGRKLSPEMKAIFFGWVANILFMKVEIPGNIKKDSHKKTVAVNGSLNETSFLLSSTQPHQDSNKLSPSPSTESNSRPLGSYGTSTYRSPSDSRSPWRRANDHPSSFGGGGSGDGERDVLALLKRIRTTLTSIDQRMLDDSRLVLIRKEWEQLARVCERMLMILFIFITVLFAVLMLHSHGQADTFTLNL